MEKSTRNLRKRLYFISAAILVAGLVSGIWFYLTAEEEADSILIYEFQHSKKYRHDLESYGGKMGVVASDLVRSLEGLFQGRTLGVTIACLAMVISLAVFFIACQLRSKTGSDPETGGRG